MKSGVAVTDTLSPFADLLIRRYLVEIAQAVRRYHERGERDLFDLFSH